MKSILLFFAMFTLSFTLNAQNLEWNTVANMPSNIDECSGMIYYNNELYVINDSGGMIVIWVLDPQTAEVIRVMKIHLSQNIDWEAMAQDDTHIYVGDIGNNSGNRTDLKIYKIPKSELNNELLPSEIITYTYSDQTNFGAAPFNTKFDAEAMSVIGDSLYIFTKDWTENVTNVYRMPKNAGDYCAQKVGTITTPGMITDSSYNEQTETLALLGYNGALQSFVMKLDVSVTNTNFTSTPTNFIVPQGLGEALQAEAIAFNDNNQFYVGNEAIEINNGAVQVDSPAKLFLANFPPSTEGSSTEDKQSLSINVYPNPATDFIKFELSNNEQVIEYAVYDMTGNKMKLPMSTDNLVMVSGLASGIYNVIATDGVHTYQSKFIKK